MLNRYEIHKNQELTLTFESLSFTSSVIVLEEDTTQFDLKVICEENSNSKLFILNHSNNECILNIHIAMKKDAQNQMGILDLQNSPLKWNHFVDLQEEGANYEILSGQLCHENIEKTCSMEVQHNAAHTTGLMKNFSVLLDKGQYEMVANGNIKKGCVEAQSHQATRVLTLGQGHKTKVIPLLLIDENDVKASHALTIGQPDEDQLYYLQSRGLTTKQAVGLLSIGYFLPVIELIDNQEEKVQLRQEMESKVGLYGSK